MDIKLKNSEQKEQSIGNTEGTVLNNGLGKDQGRILAKRPKQTKPFAAWLSFTLGIALIGICAATALLAFSHSGGTWASLKSFVADYHDSVPFKQLTYLRFRALLGLVSDEPSNRGNDEYWLRQTLNDEGQNIKYFAINTKSGLVETNIDELKGLGLSVEEAKGDSFDDMQEDQGATDEVSTSVDEREQIWNDFFPAPKHGVTPPLLEGYDYYWYFDGQKCIVVSFGELVDIARLDSGYRGLLLDPDSPYDHSDAYVNNTATKAVIGVRNEILKNPYGRSKYYEQQQILSFAWKAYVAALFIAVALLVNGIVRIEEKRKFEQQIAAWAGRIWLEPKIISLLFVLFAVPLRISTWGYGYRRWTYVAVNCVGIMLGLLFCYVLFVDLCINRRRFFTNNLINSAISWYRNYEKKYPWQKMMLKRAYILVAAEAVLAPLSVFLVICVFAGSGRGGAAFFTALVIAIFGIYLIFRYLRRYSATVSDLGMLMDHIEQVKNGNVETKLNVSPDADVYCAAQNLNSIQDGMGLAVKEKVRSERMKVDLITNVSHDLKTPLTSIVSYVELLSGEKDLPEHVNDYIAILTQKTERLQNLIQDLFDLSRATSDNLLVENETIDLVRLINQSVADMQEQIDDSGLAFRINVPDEPVHVSSDGKKLSRVFQNLISNTLKYSLTGSRVFIDLVTPGKQVVVTIKNTANYEMDFDQGEILERFTRGDLSRSTEGSGLGLSIAKSFTEACGGEFNLTVDGDQFKVELRFRRKG